jgi:hypothetical protein
LNKIVKDARTAARTDAPSSGANTHARQTHGLTPCLATTN